MVHDTIKVDAPLREVYDQWTQFEEFPRFMDGVESVEQLDDTHCHWRTKIAGVTREFDTEIVDQLPDERISWRTVGGDTKQKGVVTFQRLDDMHTRVTLAMEVEPEGVAEKAASAVGVIDSRVEGDLHRFKEYIEGRGEATGGWRGRVRPGDATSGSADTGPMGRGGTSPGGPPAEPGPKDLPPM